MRITTRLVQSTLFVFVALTATDAVAQSPSCHYRGEPAALSERPSPLDSVAITLGAEAAKLCYGRPSARGRVMVGEVEPYGTPWRMGANEPTTLHLPFPAEVGSLALEPGTYSLYAIPEAESWTIVVNSNSNRWGVPISPAVRRDDVGSFSVPTTQTGSHVEMLTLRYTGSGMSGVIVYEWEQTRFEIPIRRR